MSLDDVRRVADAVLYEGYILYPYRASAQKNRSRWQFGVLMPPAYAAADPSETTTARAECVFTRDGEPSVDVVVRFLQVQRRTGPGSPDTWDEASEEAHHLLFDYMIREIRVVGPPSLADTERFQIIWRVPEPPAAQA